MQTNRNQLFINIDRDKNNLSLVSYIYLNDPDIQTSLVIYSKNNKQVSSINRRLFDCNSVVVLVYDRHRFS